eukprot:364333-Chlamydomonas_euryale.AAC.4
MPAERGLILLAGWLAGWQEMPAGSERQPAHEHSRHRCTMTKPGTQPRCAETIGAFRGRSALCWAPPPSGTTSA